METRDLLILPTTSVPPFPVEQPYPTEINGKPLENYIQWAFLTYGITLTGLPAISVPCGFTRSGLPVGLQIVGRRHQEAAVLRAAAAFEAAAPWADKIPPAVRLSAAGVEGPRHASRTARAACRSNPARAMRRVQLRGGARWPHARRTLCTLSVRLRAPTKQMGPCRRSSRASRRSGSPVMRVRIHSCAGRRRGACRSGWRGGSSRAPPTPCGRSPRATAILASALSSALPAPRPRSSGRTNRSSR